MTFYFILIVVIFFLGFLSKWFKSSSLLLFGLMLFILMFRDVSVGTDTLNYFYHFTNGYGSDVFSLKNFEVLYSISIEALAVFSTDGYSVLYFLSLILFVFLFLSAKRYGVNLGFLLIFFLLSGIYFYAFNMARQVASVSVLLYGYSFLIYKSKYSSLWFLFWVCVAAGIHFSSIYFIVLLLIPKKELKTSIYWASFILSIFVFVFLSSFISNILSSYLGMYYENYSDILIMSNSASIAGMVYYVLLATFQFLLFLCIKDKFSRTLGNLFFISIVVFLVFKNIHPLISRVIYGISIIQIVVFSLVLMRIRFGNIMNSVEFKQFVLVLLIIIFQLYSIIDIITLNVGEFVPFYLNPIF